MSETISITSPFTGHQWFLDRRWTEYCAMLLARKVFLSPPYETIRDLMLAGF